MFSKKDEEYLIRRLGRNEVVLFLGAGFSLMAKNGLDENLPTGKSFAKKIFDFLGFDGNYEQFNTPLPTMYQALLESKRPYAEIEQLLKENFLVKSFPDKYYDITIPYWYKIYTVNIDDLIEQIYKNENDPRLRILKFPKDEYLEKDQTLTEIQGVYLHGKLPCRPNEVIFSRTQYANTTLQHNPLYFQFVQEYSTLPTIFVGTALDEPIFDQYIAARKARRTELAETRPKSFIIDPFINPIQEKIYKNTYNIEPIKASTEEFLDWLNLIADRLPDKIDTLKIVLPSLSHLLTVGRFKETYRADVNDFSQSFERVSASKTFTKSSKAFLLGTSPTWADIFHDYDAPRRINVETYNYIEELFDSPNQLSTVAILGTAGSGKSTLLKRICYALAKNGRSVYYSPSETMPNSDSLFRTLEMLNEKVVLAFDNSELVIGKLSGMTDQLKSLKHPPIIILASRTNTYDKVSGNYGPLPNLKEFFMPNLNREEIIDIIKILEQNNLLGYLKGLTPENRIKEFENRAKKQILVAMREATNGKDFDEIIKSEFDQINPAEAKLLCLCVALATDAGFTLSKQDFVSFSSEPPATCLDYLERNLKDIVIKAGPKEDKLMLRHRVIANYIIESCVKPEMLKQAYIALLTSLADQIKNSARNSRKFLLYREIINHYTIYKRFSKEINKAREVYESLAPLFSNDFQFWLQYGALESEGIGGNLQLAENYLNQAFSLKPTNLFVKNAIANLYYKKSIDTNSNVEAIEFKNYADSLVFENLSDRNHNDNYTYYIYAKGTYEYALKWAFGERDALKKYFQEIHKIVKPATSLYPNDKKLKGLTDNIFKAIMMTTTVDKDVQYPPLFAESEVQY